MTSSHRYQATFHQFAEANELDYEFLQDGADLWNDESIPDSVIESYYRPNAALDTSKVAGLELLPAVVNKIVRKTMNPRSGNPDQIRDEFWNFLHYIMTGQKINVVKFILKYIEHVTNSITYNLYYAPYIMSVILMCSNFSIENCHTIHASFKPFGQSRQMLEHPVQPLVDPQPDIAHVAPPPSPPLPAAAPPPYWLSREDYEQNYHYPLMQQVGTLHTAVEDVATRLTHVQDGMASLCVNVNSIQSDFRSFTSHFYSYFPAPAPPPQFQSYEQLPHFMPPPSEQPPPDRQE